MCLRNQNTRFILYRTKFYFWLGSFYFSLFCQIEVAIEAVHDVVGSRVSTQPSVALTLGDALKNLPLGRDGRESQKPLHLLTVLSAWSFWSVVYIAATAFSRKWPSSATKDDQQRHKCLAPAAGG